MTNHLLHGFSGVGTPLVPTEYTYAAFGGMGAVLKNGEVVGRPCVVHGMLMEYMRTEGHEPAKDGELTPTRKSTSTSWRLPFMPVQGEHKFEHDNVSTDFSLPNGQELPFWHVMFENLSILLLDASAALGCPCSEWDCLPHWPSLSGWGAGRCVVTRTEVDPESWFAGETLHGANLPVEGRIVLAIGHPDGTTDYAWGPTPAFRPAAR